MFSIESVVRLVLYLFGAGLIFALLHYLVSYMESQFPSMGPFAKFARIALVVLAVLVLIGVLLSFMGHQVVRM